MTLILLALISFGGFFWHWFTGRKKRYPLYDPPAFETPEEEEDFSPIGDVEGPDLSRGSVSDEDGYQGGSEDEFWAF